MTIKQEKIGYVTLDYTYYSGEDLYSEGAAEDHLLDYVQNHSVNEYDSYIQGSRSWSVMYHLSHIRENCVSWIPIRTNQSVLEIGSGCGAVTGAFARVAEKVTCVELSKKRSLINAHRNKEYDNVTIMVGNFEAIEPNLTEKYDYITLIGVYEYAASYISSEQPYDKFLQILKKHLNPGGKIVIAIENRLGLKYFAGCKEDHLGNYFSGIMGYSAEDGVRTFSKRSLTNLLESNGYHCKFYYPYPDYKLPHTIYSDDKLPNVGELNTNLRNFDADRMLLFDEGKAFDSFIEEGVFPEYSNSFVVMASLDEDWEKKMILPIYVKYANERLRQFRVNTMIARDKNDGHNHVFKRALSNDANEHIIALKRNYDRLTEQFSDTGLKPVGVKYIKGVERGLPIIGVAPKARDFVIFDFAKGMSIEDYLIELDNNGEYEKMEELIRLYINKLSSTKDIVKFERSSQFDEMFGKHDFAKSYKATNPCNLDMIFSNIILDKEKKEEGDWTVLDYEWVLDFPVPIPFVIYRSIFYHFKDRDTGFERYLSKKGTDVYSICGIDEVERMLFEDMEHTYQLFIIGGFASMDMMRVLMPSETMSIDKLVKRASYLRNLDTPKIYYGRGLNFTEDNQLTIIGKVEDDVVNVRIDIDRYLTSIRLDPTDYPCVVKVNNIRYTDSSGQKIEIDKALVNGHLITKSYVLYDTNDPQILIDNIPDSAKSIEFNYVVGMPLRVFFEEMLIKAKREEELAELAKRELSYRVQRKLGIIREEIVPEGYKIIDLS